jgi:hypothetical protein
MSQLTSPSGQFGQIAYTGSSYVLGTKRVSRDELDEISSGIKGGSLVGVPVFAYIHGAVAIKAADCNPFACRWDSGQSGFVYASKAEIRDWLGCKRVGKGAYKKAIAALFGLVEAYQGVLDGKGKSTGVA